jgi:hypothetical protein
VGSVFQYTGSPMALPPGGGGARPHGNTWSKERESGHWVTAPRQMPIFSNDASHVTSRTCPATQSGVAVSQHIREEAKAIMYPGKAAGSSFAPSCLLAQQNMRCSRCWTNERTIGHLPAMFRRASQEVDAPDRTSVIVETLAYGTLPQPAWLA